MARRGLIISVFIGLMSVFVWLGGFMLFAGQYLIMQITAGLLAALRRKRKFRGRNLCRIVIMERWRGTMYV